MGNHTFINLNTMEDTEKSASKINLEEVKILNSKLNNQSKNLSLSFIHETKKAKRYKLGIKR